MNLHEPKIWEIAAGATVVAGAIAAGVWLYFRKRPTPQEIEFARRSFLTQSGRLVDGTLLDLADVLAEDGRTLHMLLYDYRIGGVDYQCSQDITDMAGIIHPEDVRPGFPCSVRYQPGNPQNSIVIAEKWTGLRTHLMVPQPHRQTNPNQRAFPRRSDLSA